MEKPTEKGKRAIPEKERNPSVEERQQSSKADRAMEEALLQTNSLLTAALDSTADGLLIVNNAGRIVSYNKKFLKLWNIPDEVAVSGDDNLALSHALGQLKNPDMFIKKVRELYADPEAESFDLIEFLDGRVFERYSIPMKIEGHSSGRVWSFRDVSDRKKIEEALRSSEERYRQVVENANDGIVVVQDSTIVFANSRITEFIGGTIEEIIGKPILSFIHPEDQVKVVEINMKRMRGEPVPNRYEFRAVSNSGRITWVENSAVPITWGGAPATLGFLRDMTQQKHLETQLVQSQKMEAVGRLAGGIAHDFNNLLTVITGYVSLILSRLGDGDPFHKELMEIRSAADKTADLTRQLLAFSRKQILQPKIIDPNKIVANLQIILQRLIGEDIELSTDLENIGANVLVDPGQIEQIIVNLAVNARDAMPKGGRLTIGTKIVDLDESFAREHSPVLLGQHVVLSVSDTGVGMSQATMSKMFEPFFTTKEKGKGTGLGLSMVYGIVAQSKGHIIAESTPGKGSTFRIYLPKVEGIETNSGDIVPENAKGGKETILVVEDEPVLQILFGKILALNGYSVMSACSGDEAVLLSRDFKGPIHLLLTDVVMPGMNGRELADRIHAGRPGIKVIFMSGYTDDAIVHHGVLEDGIEFLTKPFSPETLANKVRNVLDAK
jgi:PAS domain S-box-containing protein